MAIVEIFSQSQGQKRKPFLRSLDKVLDIR